ncbi:hypothetical protein [Crossiella sp. CA198]|uniref:hypothetical protein n=1 Tax=Crossiella sp. CA198 TaxID=3455607 RepID=UPI003F8D79A5
MEPRDTGTGRAGLRQFAAQGEHVLAVLDARVIAQTEARDRLVAVHREVRLPCGQRAPPRPSLG